MSSFKQYLRIRPIDYESDMIQIEDNKVTIKDTSFKMNQSVALSGMQAEDQSFKFSKILNQGVNQDRLFQEIGAPSVDKVLQGVNSLIISYGQTGSGKTYSIFGQHPEYLLDQHQTIDEQLGKARMDQRGLVPKSVDYLLNKVIELQDTKEIVITMSFAEVYLDKIHDIGKFYLLQDGGKKILNIDRVIKDQENENLTMYENTNGQIVVKDLTLITLESIEQLYGVLKSCFQIRDQLELKGISIWERAHTIFTINVIQKDKENENIPFSNCFVQFVDLAGSERIAKSLTEGHKYQESIIINQNLSVLCKCLQSISLKGKSIPHKESKLSRILQNTLQPRSFITLIGNINPSESNYEECLATQQYIERCSKDAPKTLPISSNSSNINNLTNSSVVNDKVVQKLQRDNQELKEKLEKVQNDHKKRLHDIQMILGIEVELDKLFLKSSIRELNHLKQQKEAMIKAENLQKQNEELEKTIDNLHKHIDEIKRTEHKKWELQKCQIIELKESLVNLKQQISSKEMNSKSDIKQFQKEKEQDLKNLIDRSNALLEERNNLVFNLPTFVQNKTQENQKVNDLKKATKYEAEKEHKSQIETLKKEYQQLLENSKMQFEFYLKQKNEQIDQYVQDSKKYREEKKKQIDEMKLEMSEMYEVITRLSSILQKVEMGHYSGGIKSVNIPEKEKPILPVRQKYKHLFKVLDLKHLRQGSMRQTDVALRKSASMASVISQNQDIKKTKSGISYHPEEEQAKDEIDNEKQVQNEKDLKEQENNRIDININLNQFKNKEDFIHIKNFAERLKNSLQKSLLREKELQQRVEDFQKINNNIDITALVKEREEFKQLYQQQLKKYNQARIVLESQKRLLNMPKYNQSMQIQVRPTTASNNNKSILRLPMTTTHKNQY
ncbi:hypothetical protein ABPG72_018499 [Tetrahymena utriculariae]